MSANFVVSKQLKLNYQDRLSILVTDRFNILINNRL